jgi:predicted permease
MDSDPRDHVDAEIRFHIERRTEQLVDAGMDPRQAAAEARRRFARHDDTVRALYTAALERQRHMRIRDRWDDVWRDVRNAARGLHRSPGVTGFIVLALALGIGVNATIFSAAYGILQQRLPVPQADRLARVYRGEHSPLAREDFLHLATHTEAFAALTAERMIRVGLADSGTTEPVQAALVSANYFTGLGVAVQRGRTFSGTAGEEPGAVAVLSDRYWRVRFGGDPAVVGRTLRLADRPFTVIGVAEAGWVSTQAWRPDVFVPLSEYAGLLGVAPGTWNGSLYVTGRLRDGWTRAQAGAEITALAAALPSAAAAGTSGQPVRYRVEHARGITRELRASAKLASVFLMALAGLVLLIACANVANLLLARAAFRSREVAIRLALGVTRGRLVRQLLTESLLLALVGGAGALVLAVLATRLLAGMVPADMPVHVSLTPDGTVLAFTAGLSMATGMLFGLAPALRATRPDLQATLRGDAGRGGQRRSRLRSVFLVAQVSLGTVLLTGAVLFARSLQNARHVDPGFVPAGVVDLPIDVSLRGYDEARGRAYYAEVLDRTRALPGTRQAALANLVPLAGSNRGAPMQPAEADPDDPAAFRQVYYNTVTPGYFATLALPLRAGREFSSADNAASPPVIIVNEAAARAFWPGTAAVGRTLRIWDEGMPEATVVGVAADAKYNTLGEGETPFAYFPFGQDYRAGMVLHLRADAATAARVREVVLALDPALPLDVVRSMEADMRFALAGAQVGAALLGAFALLAIFLASIGIYGVTAFMVARRTAEMGIRRALGARSGGILRLIMWDTLRVVALGLVLGLAGGAALGRIVSSQLHGVGAIDGPTMVLVPVLLLTVAAAATLLPAGRALRSDPVAALRKE